MQTLQNGIQQVGKTFSNLFGISKSKDGNRQGKKSKKRTINLRRKNKLDGMNHYDDDDDNSKGKIKRRSRRGRRNRKSR